jgi:hypothetical protein
MVETVDDVALMRHLLGPTLFLPHPRSLASRHARAAFTRNRAVTFAAGSASYLLWPMIPEPEHPTLDSYHTAKSNHDPKGDRCDELFSRVKD